MKDNTIASILKIIEENNNLYVQIKQILKVKPFFTTSCDSRQIGIFTFSTTSTFKIIKVPAINIKRKCIKLNHPTCSDTYVIITLLHGHN